MNSKSLCMTRSFHYHRMPLHQMDSWQFWGTPPEYDGQHSWHSYRPWFFHHFNIPTSRCAAEWGLPPVKPSSQFWPSCSWCVWSPLTEPPKRHSPFPPPCAWRSTWGCQFQHVGCVGTLLSQLLHWQLPTLIQASGSSSIFAYPVLFRMVLGQSARNSLVVASSSLVSTQLNTSATLLMVPFRYSILKSNPTKVLTINAPQHQDSVSSWCRPKGCYPSTPWKVCMTGILGIAWW